MCAHRPDRPLQGYVGPVVARASFLKREALSPVWGIWRSGADFGPNWGRET